MSLELLREKFGYSEFTKKTDNREKIHEKLNAQFNTKVDFKSIKVQHQEQLEEKQRIIENLEIETSELTNEVGPDVNSSIDLMFQRNNLASGSLNFYPEAGDICDWNKIYWEVNGVTEPQLIGGNPNFSHAIKATAHRSRLSSLQIEERPR